MDWLACAAGGFEEPAARAARTLGDGVAALGTAGHVLDFDDTHAPSLAHLSAPTAPAALVVGAELGANLAQVLEAYSAGFEAMARLATANHPGLRARGWHPTSVCGVVGAAVSASRVLGLDNGSTEVAVRLALLRAGGLSAAFGGDGKALQVGLAADAGVAAARLSAAGASVGPEVYGGFEEAFGAVWPPDVLDGGGSAVEENWIKAWPCCLQTHGAIEAALRVGAVPDGEIEVAVHPVSLETAWRIDVEDGLQAKFSIPYLTAFALLRGAPRVESFAGVDSEAQALAARIALRTDAGLRESEAVLSADGVELARVEAALGSPERPMDEGALREKVRSLAGDRLEGALDDPDRAAAELLSRLS